MNKILLILTLLLSMPSFAANVVYSCKIDMSQLGPGYTDDLKFELTVGESQSSLIIQWVWYYYHVNGIIWSYNTGGGTEDDGIEGSGSSAKGLRSSYL